jgi:hypothetical protein
MTDTYPGFFGDYPTGERTAHRRHWLQLARIVLATSGVGLVFFLLQWTSAVRVAQESYLAPGTLEEAKMLNGKVSRVQWHPALKIEGERPQSGVVVPQYAGGGRGSTLIGFNSWRFGTVGEHPVWFSVCVALLVAIGAGFAVCTWFTSHPKQQNTTPQTDSAAQSPSE